MIKNIIFDIGNVLASFAWQEFFISKGYDEETVAALANATVRSGNWKEFDRGVWTYEEIIDSFVEKAPELEQEIRSVLSNIHGIVTRRDYAIPWIKELKSKGYNIYYLSNFAYKCRVECEDALDFVPYTDGGIFSYEDKLIKPDPAIYELLLSRYGLDPNECIFMDDTQANLPEAEKLGIKTILFTTKEDAEKKLEEIVNANN